MRAVKHFINDRSTVVTDAIDAAVLFGGGRLARLDGYPAIKVVVRTDWDKSKVAIVSGGGSGHEPSHAGFVGDGMLTAAVCGEIFASPSVDAVLAGILAVTGAPGCLLVVKSYTGDRLNFGLAAEKARALGLDVEMVIVADDVAIPDAERPRGIAGTLFVHKIAGDYARAGASLAAVKAVAERVVANVVSYGASLSSVTIPGQDAEQRIGPNEIELGLGIHGEPGAHVVAMMPMRDLARTMIAPIEAALDERARKAGASTSAPVALLVNDLGGVPPIEMAIATREILGAMKRDVALVVGPARLMTSLDMKGLSISAMPIDDDLARALSSPVASPDWPHARTPVSVSPLPLPEAVKLVAFTPSANAERRRVVERICTTLIEARAELDALDAKVGDGDTGTTIATAARTVLDDFDHLPFADAPALCAALADRLSRVMGGSSGILLAIFCAAMGARVGDPPDWPAALNEGVSRVRKYGGAEEGDRTMLDALVPAVNALVRGEPLANAAKAARTGADRTATMTKTRAGRSSYVREDALRGVPDPGAIAVAIVFEALSRDA